jgi:hypothetical protein
MGLSTLPLVQILNLKKKIDLETRLTTLKSRELKIQRIGSTTRPEVLANQENRTCEPKLEVL